MPLIAHLVAREAGLARRLAGWRLQREPLQHARVALILSFALALSVFTSTYLATDQRNAVDRARYAAGSDVRASFGFGTGPSVLDGAIAAAPGVVASSLVFRDSGRPGKSDVSATVLGVDPFSDVLIFRRDISVDRDVAGIVDAHSLRNGPVVGLGPETQVSAPIVRGAAGHVALNLRDCLRACKTVVVQRRECHQAGERVIGVRLLDNTGRVDEQYLSHLVQVQLAVVVVRVVGWFEFGEIDR